MDNMSTKLLWLAAPAGGAAAAAPEGGAVAGRRPVGTYPHLLVVGASNPIAELRLARLGARRGEI
jgi:hypothetical protein